MLEAMLQETPDLTAARFNLAQAFEAAGRTDDAVQAYLKVASEMPKDNRAPHQPGQAHNAERGFHEQALTQFTRPWKSIPRTRRPSTTWAPCTFG